MAKSKRFQKPNHAQRGAQGGTSKPSQSGGKYWMYGPYAVEAAIKNPRRQWGRLLATSAQADLIKKLEVSQETEMTDNAALEKILGEGVVHQGIALQVSPLPALDLSDVLPSDAPLLLLDQVTDPHNIGAMLRSAAAFGVAAIVLPKDHAPTETAVMAKSACGGLEMVPLIHVTNLVKAMEEIKTHGYWIAGLAGEATQTLEQAKLGPKTALVMGAEGPGMRRLTREHCDYLVRLPIHEQMESLNVSNAAAISLYEISRTKA